ncbi:MAG: hypothetical protein [Circoviridae sp.]|nr:MAG: hypothetical protein [Circoviridae sp.]
MFNPVLFKVLLKSVLFCLCPLSLSPLAFRPPHRSRRERRRAEHFSPERSGGDKDATSTRSVGGEGGKGVQPIDGNTALCGMEQSRAARS